MQSRALKKQSKGNDDSYGFIYVALHGQPAFRVNRSALHLLMVWVQPASRLLYQSLIRYVPFLGSVSEHDAGSLREIVCPLLPVLFCT